MDESAAKPRTAPVVNRLRALQLELLVVVLCFVLPSFLYGLAPPVQQLGRTGLGTIVDVLTGLAYGGITPFLLWSSGDPLTRFGFRRPQLLRDIALGIVIAGIFVVPATYVLTHVLRSEPIRFYASLRHQLFFNSTAGTAFAVFAIACSAAWQEVLFRGLMIPRIRELTGRGWIAVTGSAVLFSVVHTYQGIWQLPTHFVVGLMCGLVFLRTGSLWPVIIAHTLMNTAAFYGF